MKETDVPMGEGAWMDSEPTATDDPNAIGISAAELDEIPASAEPRLLDALIRFEQAHRRQSVDDMRSCFHDEALVESVASNGRPVGRDETVEALAHAFADGVYSIRDWRYDELAPQIVLSWTSARHLIDGAGMRDETVCRLHVGRDGLMWRVKLFRSREDALRYLDEVGPSLGLTSA
jgi:hypothetical protein